MKRCCSVSSRAVTPCSRARPGSARRCSCARSRRRWSCASRVSSSRPISCRATSSHQRRRRGRARAQALRAVEGADSGSSCSPTINRATPSAERAAQAMAEETVTISDAARSRRRSSCSRGESDRDGGHLSLPEAARSLSLRDPVPQPDEDTLVGILERRARKTQVPKVIDDAQLLAILRSCAT